MKKTEPNKGWTPADISMLVAALAPLILMLIQALASQPQTPATKGQTAKLQKALQGLK